MWTSLSTALSLIGLLIYFPGSECLKLHQVTIPGHVRRGQDTVLSCVYDLEDRQLYSIKWYKDGREFFRFEPSLLSPKKTFPQSHIFVNVAKSNATHVYLRSAILRYTGWYVCEISTEAPEFETVQGKGHVQVVVFPMDGPIIVGARSRYDVGDRVRVNCTSRRSKPVAELSWYINNEQVAFEHLHHWAPVIEDDDLISITMGLHFRVRERHFHRGNIKLKCVSQLRVPSPPDEVASPAEAMLARPLYWRSTEASAVRRRAPQVSRVVDAEAAAARYNSSRAMCQELARWVIFAVSLVLAR